MSRAFWVWRRKAIRSPLGDHTGLLSALSVSLMRLTPSGLRRSRPSASSSVKTSHWPSGDQSPMRSRAGVKVRRVSRASATAAI